eukprot:scaffold996_cov271-Chaetoceros_neogracile.AAC.18
MRTLYILTLIVQTALGNSWEGCITEKQHLTEEGSALVIKDQETAVCLTIAIDEGNWANPTEYKRFSFAPQADDYSRFVVEDYITTKHTNVTTFASSQTALSFQRMYFDSLLGVFPYLTAIVDVVDGVVRGIAWDDACIFCGADKCEENTFNFKGLPAFPQESTKGCYIPLHVVWTGTDKNGDYLTSSSKRFSAFSPKQIRDQLKDALTKVKDEIAA